MTEQNKKKYIKNFIGKFFKFIKRNLKNIMIFGIPFFIAGIFIGFTLNITCDNCESNKILKKPLEEVLEKTA